MEILHRGEVNGGKENKSDGSDEEDEGGDDR